MTAQIIPVATFDLVVFGGTGDLARRKLLPALYYRDLDGQLTADSLIIGVARRKLELAAYWRKPSGSRHTRPKPRCAST